MEHETKEDKAEHASHEHLHHEHAHVGGVAKHDKMANYAYGIALAVGIILIAINFSNANYLYAGTALGALIVLVPIYLRKYRIATILGTVLILLLTIAYRVTLLHYFGFYEPDGFYHYSVIRAAILHNFVVPQFLSISGWPAHTAVSEPVGLYWATLIPYFFLQFFGVSYYDVMRLIPILFALVDVIATYYLIQEFNKDRVFGLLGMLFVALSMGDAARTSATVYRGDGFVTIFVIVGLIFMIRTLKSEDKNKLLGYALLTGLMLSLGNIVWNGASFGIAIYILALAMILLYAFLTEKLDTIKRIRYLILALGFWYVLSSAYKALNLIGTQNEAFTGIYFLVLFALILIGNELALFLIKSKERFGLYVSTLKKRLTTALLFALGSVLFIYLLAPQIVQSIFVTSGFQTNIAFAASIQELQAPSSSFLFASFGATLFMAPMSILMYFSTYYPGIVDLFWVAMMVVASMYFFMDFEGVEHDKFLSGRAVIKFRASDALFVFIAYYAVTAYLQMHAVRFNSLLSIPLAIFTAYTMYWVLLWLKNFNRLSFALGLGLLAVLIGYIMLIDTGYSVTLIQADNINPQFITALQWIHGNTPSNAVILTLWPDGSLVEGVANKTSVTDSVGSQNRSKAGPFAMWLFNTTKNPQFLTGKINGRPDYILARYTWLQETGGIYTETEFNATTYNQSIVSSMLARLHLNSTSQLTRNQSGAISQAISQLYAYSIFTTFQENVNQTGQTYAFQSPQGYQATVKIGTYNGTQKVNGYLTFGQYVAPFRSIVFYNQQNASYQVLQQAYNATSNQTLVMQYSPVPKQGAYVNITGVYMMNAGIANSNMFKLLFECGVGSCSYNNNVATLQLVYINQDTKLFKVTYNSTVRAQ
ncbi:MAG: hypothetical protein KGH53_01125 [Candidatus Micrarchaeota archaeon]|nr:hypothetical protein [Candidatus Micrarchaeota archaeon]